MTSLQLIDVRHQSYLLSNIMTHFIQTVVPAFKPPQSVQVPFWLGVLLKRQRRARIIPPDWLHYEVLQRLLKEEEEEQRFSTLPFQWLEISSALLDRLDAYIPTQFRFLILCLVQATTLSSLN
jgi:GINS complex subunit 2